MKTHKRSCYSLQLWRRFKKFPKLKEMEEADRKSRNDVFHFNPNPMGGKGKRVSARWMAKHFMAKGGGYSMDRSAKAQEWHRKWCKLYKEQQEFRNAVVKKLMQERNIPWNEGWGSYCHCDCGFKKPTGPRPAAALR